jgi:hypothetical protein
MTERDSLLNGDTPLTYPYRSFSFINFAVVSVW